MIVLLIVLGLLLWLAWRNGRLQQLARRVRDWLLWSERHALFGALALAGAVGLTVGFAASRGDSPPPAPAAAASPQPSASPTRAPTDWLLDEPSPLPTVAPSEQAVDREQVAKRARTWAVTFLAGHDTDDETAWRDDLAALSVPSLRLYLASIAGDAVPDATVKQVEVEQVGPFEAAATVELSDGPGILLLLRQADDDWLVSDFTEAE